jgi:ParB/RepB/Spo0J family partition protein
MAHGTHGDSLNHISISDIEVGSRFRKDYGDIAQLCHSIKKNGLITPVAVCKSSCYSASRETDRPYVLLAGGRRMKAILELGWANVPCRIYDQPLSEFDFRSIELAENFDRKDMDYAEELAIKREINNLQIAIHGPKFSKAPDAPGWSQADTAKLIKESPSSLARDLQLADAIEKFPELGLASCKNKAEAMKRMKEVSKTLTNGAAATAYKNGAGASDKLFQKLSSSYIIGDCMDTLKKIPSNTMNFIEIDPPYAIDLVNQKKDNSCIGYNEIEASTYITFMSKLFDECYRVLRSDSWLICWFGPDPWFQPIASAMQAYGFKMNLLPGIWTKPSGQTAQPETYLGNSYETFFYARKGQPKLQKPGRSNNFNFGTVPPTQKRHPTERPIELMLELYSTFTAPGSTGYIPFLGSGVSLIAGHMLSMNLIGNDLTKEYKDSYILKLKELLHHD